MKIIISPEFGERIDLTQLTRDLMARTEKDLGVRPEWVAVGHFNTEHPHAHVALRGIAKDGEEIRLPREYVKAGLRFDCRRPLYSAARPSHGILPFEAARREIRERRFTSLDRMILRAAAPDSENPYSTLTITIDDRRLDHASSASLRVQHLLARLGVLEDMD